MFRSLRLSLLYEEVFWNEQSVLPIVQRTILVEFDGIFSTAEPWLWHGQGLNNKSCDDWEELHFSWARIDSRVVRMGEEDDGAYF